MILRWVKTFLFLLFFSYSTVSFSQSETLFSSTEPLKIRIEGDWSAILKKRYLDPVIAKSLRIPVKLVILDQKNSETTISAELGLRGNTSLSPLECSVPKYSLYFTVNNVSGTLLEGREQLAFGSHCSYRGGNSDLYGRSYDGKSPHREAMVYRLLEILEIPSFKARPIIVQYIENQIEAENRSQALWHQAFVLESLKQFEMRMNYELVDEESAHLIDLASEPKATLKKIIKVALFNEMIGNNDWKVNFNEPFSERLTWNIYLAKDRSRLFFEVIPNDFDLAAVVTRLQGKTEASSEVLKKFSQSEIVLAKDLFQQKRKVLYSEIESLKKLDLLGYEHFKMKLDQFFNKKPYP